jgi:hypothetical protein
MPQVHITALVPTPAMKQNIIHFMVPNIKMIFHIPFCKADIKHSFFWSCVKYTYSNLKYVLLLAVLFLLKKKQTFDFRVC